MNHPFGAEFSASIRNKPKKTFMYTPAIQLSSDDEDDEFYNQTVSSKSSASMKDTMHVWSTSNPSKPCCEIQHADKKQLVSLNDPTTTTTLDPIDEEHLLDPHHHHSEHTINSSSSSLHHDVDIIKPMIHPITVPLSNGYTCSFPYHPYPSQIELMNRVIFTLDHTEKGHHAILESPTGTGKTLSLLCATLCWQQHFKAKIIQQWKEKHETHNKEHVHSSSSSTSSSWTSTANSGSTHDTRMNEFTTVPAEVSSSSSPLKRLHDSKILSLDSNHPWSTGTSNTNTSSRSSHHDESTTIPPPSTKKQKLDMNNTSSECNMQQISKILLYLQKGFTNKAEREILKSTKLPKIIYSCRTHSQIKQVVKELRKTCYAPKMTILGSKQQYCIHPMMNHGSSKNHSHHGTTSTCDVNTECQKLIDASNCYYYKNMHALVKSSNYSPHSKHLIYDIEDLIKEGKRLKSCPYFASKEFLLDPEIELILCPYNYILSPITREMMSLDVHNSVCIFDEAHNLEDACRESTSLTLSEYELEHVCAFELNFILSKMMNSTIVSNRNSTLNSSTTVTNFTTNSTIHSNPTTHHDEWNSTKIQYKYYKILVDFILKILQWMNMQVLTPLSNDDSSIEGKIIKEQDGIMNEFMKHIFDPRNMMHQELKQIKDALFHVKSCTPSNKKQDLRLSQRSLNMLQELCTIFDLMLRDDFKFMKDYAIVLIKKAVPHHLNTITTNANTNANANTNTTTASSSSSTTSSSTSSHSSSYNIHHQRMVRTDGINSSSSGIPSLTNVPTTTSSSLTIEYQINFWCLSPAVAFEELQFNSKCTLLASGTLSPLDTFSNELKTQFTTTFEAEHVIEQDQVWVGTLGQSHGVSLNANYTNSNTTQYQDELGRIILSICQQDCTRNGGILVFFPSYSFMNKILKRWKSYNHSIPSSNCSSLLKQIEQVKDVFFEEKGTSIEETISKYYASIEEHKNRNNTITTTTTTTSTARTRTTASTTTSAARTTTKATSKNGALFIAVCRGKVSEGIDFSNDKCRMVICIGIPYPNIKDLKVSLKREYNDSVNNASNNNGNTGHSNSYSNNNNSNSNNNSMDGEHWYTSQAFRALNQAVGRCIRHKNDYGAILLIDERFQNKNSAKTVNAFSKWIRTRIVNYPSLESSLKSLSEFFEWNHEHFSENTTTTTTTTTTTNTTNTTTTTTTPTTTNTFRAEQHIRSTLKEQINTHRRRSIVRSDVILNDDSSNESLEMLSDDDEMTNDDDETKLQIPFMEQNSTPTTLISPHRTLPQSSHATHHGLSKNRMPNPMVTTTQSNSSSSTTDTRRHRMDSTATIYCSSCQKTLVSMNSSCQVISLLQPPPHHSMLRSILSSFENVYAQDQVLRVDSKLTSMIPCRQEYSSNQNHWTFYHHESTSPLDDSFGHHVATLDSSQMKHVLKFTNQQQQQDFSIQLSMKDKSQNKIITPFSESEGVVYSVLFCKNCSFVSGVKIIATDEDHQQDINCSYLFIPTTTRRCFMNQKGDEPVDSNATNNTFRNEGEVVVISSDDDDNE